MIYPCPFFNLDSEECPFINSGECNDYTLYPLHEDAWCVKMICKGIDREFEEMFVRRPEEIMNDNMRLVSQAWKEFKREGEERGLVKPAQGVH